MAEKKLNDVEILENLVCVEIPDTRKLQEIRLKSVGKMTSYEFHMKKYFHDKWENTPRLVRLSDEELKRTYSLAIPLSFPLSDRGSNQSYFSFRWTSYDCQKGAMHLTTKKGLNELNKIFVKNNIPITPELSFGKIFDIGRDDIPGLSVPHSFEKDGMFFRHQFVDCEIEVYAAPYYFLEELTIVEEKEKEFYDHHSFSQSKSKIELRNFCCEATFFNLSHMHEENQPKEYLPMILNEEAEQRIGETTHQGRILKSSKNLLKIGEPVLIYSPEWIEEN